MLHDDGVILIKSEKKKKKNMIAFTERFLWPKSQNMNSQNTTDCKKSLSGVCVYFFLHGWSHSSALRCTLLQARADMSLFKILCTVQTLHSLSSLSECPVHI